jgi:hypothetical protein
MFSFIKASWLFWIMVILAFIYGLFKPKIKGFMGEKKVSAILSLLDKEKYMLLNDVMLEYDGRTSQIDHILVSNYGVFVIETKNCKGWIYGDEYSQYWTQVIYKRKERLYNPIRQNYGHVQALKIALSEFGEIKFIPIVVFSVQADLKVETKSEVIYTVNLHKTIKKYSEEVLSDSVKEKIFNKILSLNVGDREKRREHVNSIREERRKVQNNVGANICPKCGGTLVERKGKYGFFKGCNNYPKCKFVAK